MAQVFDRITVHPQQCGGRPCVRGMRIRVSDVLELLADGMTAEAILDEVRTNLATFLPVAFCLFATFRSVSFADPSANVWHRVVARSDSGRSLKRVIHLEIIAGLFVVVVHQDRIARARVLWRHAVVHRNRRGSGEARGALGERLEHRAANDRLLHRTSTLRIIRVTRRDVDTDGSPEVAVLHCE